MYIDTHCHLDSKDYNEDLEQILQNSKTLGISKIIIPGADINDLTKARDLSTKFDMIYFASGIHPNEAEQFSKESKIKLKKHLEDKKCVAVGEIGLDYHYLDEQNKDSQVALQKSVFESQIELALDFNKPIIIHTRESNANVVEILKEYENSLKAVIFHCFGGDTSLIDCLKCKIYFGIGGVISFKNANILKQGVTKLPLDSIILETDSPYLAPTPHRGKRNTPEFIPLIASHLADSLNLSIEKVAEITTTNANIAFEF